VDDHAAGIEVDVLPAQRDQLAEAQAGVGGEAKQLGVLCVLACPPGDLIRTQVGGLLAAVGPVGGCASEGRQVVRVDAARVVEDR
jgi:hypothetical protein